MLSTPSFSLTMHFHLNAVRRAWNIACNNAELLDVAGISEPALTVSGCLVSVAADEAMNDTDQVFFGEEVEGLKVEYNVVRQYNIHSRGTSSCLYLQPELVR